jgi:hypothetical protein
MTAVVAVVMLLALMVGDVGLYLAGRARATAAADAAALAAAPVTFHGFGSSGSPASEAARFASLNGMTVVACECPVDASWAARSVSVTVAGPVDLIVFGSPTVSARAVAEFTPTLLVDQSGLGPRPGTITRLPPDRSVTGRASPPILPRSTQVDQ